MIKILIVDDELFARVFVRQVLKTATDIIIVGEAENGTMAIEMAKELKPDVITMDILMPGMDGIEATKRILSFMSVPIIMVSQLTEEDSAHTIKALQLGAVDYISKSSTHLSLDIHHISKSLPEKLRYWANRFGQQSKMPGNALVDNYILHPQPLPAHPQVVLIAVSVGGPQVLPDLLMAMGSLACPVIIAQQMPAIFTQAYVTQLGKQTGIPIKIAQGGHILEQKTIYVLPGGTDAILGHHPGQSGMVLTIGLQTGSQVHPCANALFTSATLTMESAVAVILSGVGSNGANGAKAFQQKGWPVFIQQPHSCVVDEMPKAALQIGGASHLLSAHEIGSLLAANYR